MAPRAFACPKCKTKLTAPEGAARFRCPRCKTVLSAPGQGQAPPPAPEGVQGAAAPEATPAPAPEEDLVGRKLGAYEVTRFIERGSLGAVYEAVQEGLNRQVALKVLSSEAARDSACLAAFRREAQAAARLNHPNIVQIFDIVEDDGVHFFAMEYVDGESLADRLERQGHLAPADALQIASTVAAALDHAHEHMLIHRNLKPENILFTRRGDVKVSDLGLLASLEESAVSIVEGIAGGPRFMAPELTKSPEVADCRADIYSLGCVLYYALTGQPPFAGATAADLVDQHATAPFPSAKALFPRMPQAVDELLQRMCAKDPGARFQTYGELLERLESLSQAAAVRSPGATTQARPGTSKWPVLVGGVAAAALVGLIAYLLISRFGGEPEKAKGPPKAERPAKAEPKKPPEPEEEVPEFAPETVPGTEYQPTEKTEPKAPQEKEPSKKKTPEPKAPEPPEKAQPPAWKAELAQAKKAIQADVGAGRYGKAIAALQKVAGKYEAPELRAAVQKAVQAVRQQAADATRVALQRARDLAQGGQYDQARAALQDVVQSAGIPDQVKAAQAALASVAQHQKLRQAAERLSQEAQAASQQAERQAKARAKFQKTLQAVEEKLKSWKLKEALAALEGLDVAPPAIAAQAKQFRGTIEALIAFRKRMIEHIKTAKPPLDKRALRIPGLNGTLVGADEDAITIETPFGDQTRTEKVPWSELRPVSAELLAKRVAAPDDPRDALATAILLRILGDPEKAQNYLARAKELGAKVAAPAEEGAAREAAGANAAQALADAAAHRLSGRHDQAKEALAAYRERFGETPFFKEHQEAFKLVKGYSPITVPEPTEVAQPPEKPKPPTEEPPKPKPKGKAKPKPKPKPKGKGKPHKINPKALALYKKAAQKFQSRRYADAKAALDELKEKFPKSTLHDDGKRKPSVPAMGKAIADRGPRITMSRSGEGDVRSLTEAARAMEKPRTTLLIHSGSYDGSLTLLGEQAAGLVIRGVGERPPRLQGESNSPSILRFPADSKDLWLERLEFVQAERPLFIGPRSSATLRNVVALQDVKMGLDKFPATPVTIAGSLMKVSGLTNATARTSAFYCDETPIDHNQLTACIVAGPQLAFYKMKLTDCLVLGPLTLLRGNRLNHVTIIGPIKVPRDATGNTITNSIVDGIKTWEPDPDAKEKPPVHLTLKSTAFRRKAPRFPKDIVKTDEHVKKVPVEFVGPGAGDYRLVENSHLRGEAADETDPGCRFPPEMRELLKRARRFPAILRPSGRR